MIGVSLAASALTVERGVQVNVNMNSGEMSIGELARRFGLAPHVLRHWESMGLLTPSRRVNGRRRYDDGHLTDIAIIQLGKDSGLSLERLRYLLAEGVGRADRAALLRAHRAALAHRIAAAQASLEVVDHALDCAAPDFRRCPDFLAKVEDYLAAASVDRAAPEG
ncbi:MerR family transcriptional regulator [Actinokineospora iranica]|uniref:DNA-binding transcriptional regulator, MerR family n=1 Tax=Actinokineospora iranica TaxID=1271860 RepID=A0A1G6RZ84_9PSEU|nr:MerR family transcriptional regulator [Actinokineospora iranica]SDD09266.1 DNA-binding transcriptional regulator, MerR family [Actinokineospora iranica]